MRSYVLASLLGLAGCGVPKSDAEDDSETGESDSGEGDSGEIAYPALPDIDLDQWCGDVDSPAVDVVDANHAELRELGPCGHLVSTSNLDTEPSFWLTMPNGVREPFEPGGPTFDATGQLLFLHSNDPTPNIQLHSVATGPVESFEDYAFIRYGFVRSADPEHPSVAWICGHQNRKLWAVVANQTIELMADISQCTWMAGSRGNSKLLVPRNGQLYVVDVDTGEQLPIATDGFYTDQTPTGELRADTLEINYAGSLAIHEVVVGQDDGHENSYTSVEKRIIAIDRREVVHVCAGYTKLIQAPTEHAPAFLLCDEDLFVWHDDALVRLNEGPLQGYELADNGTLLFGQSAGEEFETWRVDVETPTEIELITVSKSGAEEISPNGEVMFYSEPTDTCVDADCTEYLQEVRQWTRTGGVSEPVLWPGPLELTLAFDDGSAVAWVEGPVAALLFFGADGQFVRQWEFGVEALSQIQRLADGRVLLTTMDLATTMRNVWSIDLAASEPTHVLGPVDSEPYLDGQRRRMALDTDTALYWGQL